MNSTKKLIIATVLLFQLSGYVYADNWSDAFLAFGGGIDPASAAQRVASHPGSLSSLNALTISKKLGTQEGNAIGRYASFDKKNLFVSTLQDANVQAAAQAIINAAPVRSAAIVAQPVVQQPAPANAGWNWFGSAAPANDAQSAAQAQQKADVAAATANNQALSKLVNSGATGLPLYKGYIDLVFNLLQQGINGIVDPVVQQQVLQYAQGKLNSLKASAAAANKYNSRTLGRMNSKKASKKSNNMQAHIKA